MTRRATLRLIGGGVAGAALAAAGGLTQALGFTATVAETAASEPAPVVPAGGAGLFDVDPAQPALSQAAGSVVTGDVAALPEGVEL